MRCGHVHFNEIITLVSVLLSQNKQVNPKQSNNSIH